METPVLDVFRPAVWATVRLFFVDRLEGTEHISREDPSIIAPDHATFTDPPLLRNCPVVDVRHAVRVLADRVREVVGAMEPPAADQRA